MKSRRDLDPRMDAMPASSLIRRSSPIVHFGKLVLPHFPETSPQFSYPRLRGCGGVSAFQNNGTVRGKVRRACGYISLRVLPAEAVLLASIESLELSWVSIHYTIVKQIEFIL